MLGVVLLLCVQSCYIIHFCVRTFGCEWIASQLTDTTMLVLLLPCTYLVAGLPACLVPTAVSAVNLSVPSPHNIASLISIALTDTYIQNMQQHQVH